MVGKKLHEFANHALSVSVADQTETVISQTAKNTTRYANNTIHQNISKETMSVMVRSVLIMEKGAKIGVASGNVSSKEAVEKVVKNSNEIAKNQQVDPYFISLAKPNEIQESNAFCPDVEDLTVKEKAYFVKDIIDQAKEEDITVSGIFETSVGKTLIANSLGVSVSEPFTSTTITCIAQGKNQGTGFASEVSWKFNEGMIKRVAKTAIKKAKESQNPIDLPAGKYDVILEEEAAGDLLSYLAYIGFGGKHYHEGQSFVAGNIGKKVLGENINISDDPYHPEGMPTSFDWEGNPKEQIVLVEKGVIKNVVYDTYIGGKYGKKSTGHSIGPSSLGPIPLNLILSPGKSSVEEMIKNTKKGILVTRFHYTNVHHYKKLNMTGMTKDGTFYVEDGKIKAPIKNLRFTQSIVEALNNVEEIGEELKLVDSIGTHLAPALKIKDFNFTSKTEHY